MKKLLSFLLTAVMACTLLFTVACNTKDANTIYVGVLQVATHDALDDARKGFEDTLNAWATANGKKVEFNRQNANGDSQNELTLADSIFSSNPDLVLGIATSSARALVNAAPTSTPVFFTAVTDPASENLVRENSAGTSDMNPVAEQIALIREINPNAKTIGFLYNSSESNSVTQFNLAQDKCDELGLTLRSFPVAQSSDISTVVDSISGVDAVYVPTDNLMAENITLICSILHDKHIPVVAGESGMCDDGEAVVTLGIDYYELGVQTAQMAIKVLNGEANIADLSFEFYNKEPSFFINEQNALTAGLSQSLIDSLKSAHSA